MIILELQIKELFIFDPEND